MKQPSKLLKELSEEVRTIRKSKRETSSLADQICAKVLAAFDASAIRPAAAPTSPAKGSQATTRKPALNDSRWRTKAAKPKARSVAAPKASPFRTNEGKKIEGKGNRREKAPVNVETETRPRPKPGKVTPFMKAQREKLQLLRDTILDSMAGVAKDTLRSRPEGSEASAFGMHQADAGSDAYDKDFALSLLSQEQDALYEIEEAIKRVDNGTYGICEMSGKPIPVARLEALPFARYTVECQSELERTKKHQRSPATISSLFEQAENQDENGNGESNREETTLSPPISQTPVFHPFTKKCLESATWIEDQISRSPIQDFEWSCAIIPLCKGFEFEIIHRIIEPLKAKSSADSLKDDLADQDLGKVARFCAGKAPKPPELGVFAWFLRTAIHSKSRRESSVILRTFLALIAAMADPNWITEPKSLLATLEELTSKYRNPSAHTATMDERDYQACRELISKPETGALWKLAEATLMRSEPTAQSETSTT